MNTNVKYAIRTLILLSLGIIALIGLFSEPSEDSASWYLDFLTSKSIGIAAMYTVFRLNRRWNVTF